MRRILGSGLLLISLPLTALAVCHHLADMSPNAIAERIQPVGKVAVEGGGGVKAALVEPQALSANAGEERYHSTCAVCHQTGVAGAPKLRDKADWGPRMSVGMEGMLEIAKKGKGAMPPKGTCMQCSDEELRKTIEYMIPQK